MKNWQPIATAPIPKKDSAFENAGYSPYVLVVDKYGIVREAHTINFTWFEVNNPIDPIKQPTHWMPLPIKQQSSKKMKLVPDKKDYLQDVQSMTDNSKGDLSPEDFIEFANEAIEILQKKLEEVQEDISQKVEELVDSFGGADCTLRQLKGE